MEKVYFWRRKFWRLVCLGFLCARLCLETQLAALRLRVLQHWFSNWPGPVALGPFPVSGDDWRRMYLMPRAVLRRGVRCCPECQNVRRSCWSISVEWLQNFSGFWETSRSNIFFRGHLNRMPCQLGVQLQLVFADGHSIDWGMKCILSSWSLRGVQWKVAEGPVLIQWSCWEGGHLEALLFLPLLTLLPIGWIQNLSAPGTLLYESERMHLV